MQTRTTITARWIAAADQPPIEDGWLEIADGRILTVEKRAGRTAEHDFGDAIILPGLVNPHTHLDLTGALDQTPPQEIFPDWLREVIAYRKTRSPEQVAADIADGIHQSIQAGTTLLGDIAAGGMSWDAIAASPLNAVVFYELLGLTADRAQTSVEAGMYWAQTHAQTYWVQNDTLTLRLRPGLSPHAPYSFRFDRLTDIASIPVPIAIHFAESLDEIDLIADHDGEFVPFLEELGVWDPTGLPVLDGGAHPLQAAKQLLLIHGNYLPADAAIPAGATVVYCPRTHAAFEHPPHPFREWLQRGIRVALATDSLASNPDLSVLAEARFVFAEHPDIDPATLLNMITQTGAAALGFGDICGAIKPGMAADLCIVYLPREASIDPLRGVFATTTPVRAVFIDGRRVV